MDLDKLDRIIEIAFTNFYSLAKENHRIELNGLDMSLEHMGLLYTAVGCSLTLQYPLFIKTSFKNFFKIKRTFKKQLKICWLHKPTASYPSCNEFIHYIEDNQNYKNAFADIFTEIYGKDNNESHNLH